MRALALRLRTMRSLQTYTPPTMFGKTGTIRAQPTNGSVNRLLPADRAVHDWYRFVLSYPPHLVRYYAERFGLGQGSRLLDPFCGTGTTLVEAKKLGIDSVGIEANPLAQFASAVKTDWDVDPLELRTQAELVADATRDELSRQGIRDSLLPLFEGATQPKEIELRRLPPDTRKLLLTNSISPYPEHKTLTLLDQIRQSGAGKFEACERLAVAKCLVANYGNLRFGPEVGIGRIKEDTPVIDPWIESVRVMTDDLGHINPLASVKCEIHLADARCASELFPAESIDSVITSPPYPNEKDYTRTTRLESAFLGFVRNRDELRSLKRNLVRSNTRGVYKGDDDDSLVSGNRRIMRIAREIERRRVSMGKTSGFERLYARVAQLYFGGMARHFADLRRVLRPGARLAYVVGDQASYLRVMIRTGELLGEIAESLGYVVEDLELFRTRIATATGEMLREEVLILRWNGRKPKRRQPR